jgi:D-3-phosphoglycerate dehydrogenase / 2-oxoglutarate reductase
MSRAPLRIVVPGDEPPQIQESPHLERLRAYGDVVVHRDRPRTLGEQLDRARDAVCLVNSRVSVRWPAEALRALPHLRMVTACGVGVDAFDVDAARALGIVVCNIPGKTAPIVAEHAFGLMLAAAKRAAFQTAAVKAGQWIRVDNIYLRGKTLGIVGTGNIGAEVARLGRAIGMEVIAWTFHPSAERAAALCVRFVELDELLRTADVVSLHVKLTTESRGLIGRRELELLKPGAIVVNTARGAVLDTVALADAVQTGHVGAAALDVFDEEPVRPDHPILQCDQVVLTPHNADETPEGTDRINAGAVDNVMAFLEGRPQNVVR